jgi:Fe-S cluster assembly ATP-binding protein
VVIPVLDLVDIGLSIGGRPILHDLNLHVLPGEIHAILGANGTGKSTLASVVMGLSGFSPTSGKVIFQGEDITALSISGRAKRGITLTWQEPARFEGLTVGEYLELGRQCSPGGGPSPGECLLMVGLPPDRYLQRAVDSTLSGGERKRVELASVLAMEPRLSILDEPDSGIDALSLTISGRRPNPCEKRRLRAPDHPPERNRRFSGPGFFLVRGHHPENRRSRGHRAFFPEPLPGVPPWERASQGGPAP